MSNTAHDDWVSMCERWSALAREYYEPLSESQCDKIVQETLQVIKTHKLPDGTTGIGASGSGDTLQLDADERYVRFMIRKTLPGADMKRVVDHTWTLYQDAELYKEAHLGNDSEMFHETLQHISPDVIIIQRVEKYPNLDQLTHSLAIIFRVQTETGYMIVIRCIESPRLQSQLKSEGLSLGGTFAWDRFDVVQGDSDAIHFTTTGSIGSDNPSYAKRWRDAMLTALVRYETQLKDSSIVPTKADSDVPTDGQLTNVCP